MDGFDILDILDIFDIETVRMNPSLQNITKLEILLQNKYSNKYLFKDAYKMTQEELLNHLEDLQNRGPGTSFSVPDASLEGLALCPIEVSLRSLISKDIFDRLQKDTIVKDSDENAYLDSNYECESYYSYNNSDDEAEEQDTEQDPETERDPERDPDQEIEISLEMDRESFDDEVKDYASDTDSEFST